MSFHFRIHYDNSNGFVNPHLWQWADGSTATSDLAASGGDGFGVFFDLDTSRTEFRFKFKDGPGTNGPWEGSSFDRFYSWLTLDATAITPDEVWTTGRNAFVYHVEPRAAEAETAETAIRRLSFKPGVFIPDS
jgi:hypothetical protein